MSKAVYVGSFDPITNGHIDILLRAGNIFDEIIIGVGNNSRKNTLFSIEERVELIKQVCRKGCSGVYAFDELAVDFARKHNARAIIRGIRNNPDFEAEFAFAHVNMSLAPGIEHVYLMSSKEDHFVSSSIVKELWLYGTNYKSMVPYPVFEALENKRKENK